VLLKLLRYSLLSLVLLLVFIASALLSMRFAIHGRELNVPSLVGLTPAEAERVAGANGLVLSVESRFYSSQVPRGRIVSQAPAPETRVRRGWKVQVAESLGPQRGAIPNLIGQSEHTAGLNISRHGLEIGSVARLHLPGVQSDTVVAQKPPPDAKDAPSPMIDLVFSAADNGQRYVMPSFVGKTLGESSVVIKNAGIKVGKAWTAAGVSVKVGPRASSRVIIKQYPPAGHTVSAGASINFEVSGKPRPSATDQPEEERRFEE
jgi:beta-lactam-binding protein with PASTA domain